MLAAVAELFAAASAVAPAELVHSRVLSEMPCKNAYGGTFRTPTLGPSAMQLIEDRVQLLPACLRGCCFLLPNTLASVQNH